MTAKEFLENNLKGYDGFTSEKKVNVIISIAEKYKEEAKITKGISKRNLLIMSDKFNTYRDWLGSGITTYKEILASINEEKKSIEQKIKGDDFNREVLIYKLLDIEIKKKHIQQVQRIINHHK